MFSAESSEGNAVVSILTHLSLRQGRGTECSAKPREEGEGRAGGEGRAPHAALRLRGREETVVAKVPSQQKRKDYAVKHDWSEAHGQPELPFGLSQSKGGGVGMGRASAYRITTEVLQESLGDLDFCKRLSVALGAEALHQMSKEVCHLSTPPNSVII